MKKVLAGLGAASAVLATPALTYAQFITGGSDVSGGVSTGVLQSLLKPFIPQSTGPLNLEQLFITVLNLIILVAGIIAILYLIWAGVQYITAGGDDEKAKKARAGIFNAVIGIVVIILSYAIIVYVSRIVNGAGRTLDSQTNTGGF